MRSLFLVLTALSGIIAAPLPQVLDGSNGLGLPFFSQPLLLAANTEEPEQQPEQKPEQQQEKQPESPSKKGGTGDQSEEILLRNGITWPLKAPVPPSEMQWNQGEDALPKVGPTILNQVGDALKPAAEVGTTVLNGLSIIPNAANALSGFEWQLINGAWQFVNLGQQ